MCARFFLSGSGTHIVRAQRLIAEFSAGLLPMNGEWLQQSQLRMVMDNGSCRWPNAPHVPCEGTEL